MAAILSLWRGRRTATVTIGTAAAAAAGRTRHRLHYGTELVVGLLAEPLSAVGSHHG
jgi:hypothetical protein